MSQAASSVQGGAEGGKSHIKCRIPQRLVQGRPRNGLKPKFNNNNSESGKSKFEVVSAQHPRNGPRPRSEEVSRPKSAGRAKEDPQQQFWGSQYQPVHPAQLARQTRQRPSTLPKKNEVYNTSRRQVIMVPTTQKVGKIIPSANACGFIPDQETISKYDEYEILQNNYLNSAHILDSNDEESVSSCNEKIMRLRIRWQENIVNFENTKKQLDEQQRWLMELYASLRITQQEMSELGQKVTLPPSDDLRIMNVAKLTPEQLLQLCAGTLPTLPESGTGGSSAKMPLAINLNALYDKLANIVDTCDKTLINRMEIIEWFEEITAQKEISKNCLVKKVNQFKVGNDMLKCTLENNKEEYMRNINEAIEYVKKSLNEAAAHQMRSEELMRKLAELSSTNENLRKQLQHRGTESRVSNKAKLEELERELKDEKCKKMALRDRLARAEGQIRTREETTAQLEAAWEQAQSKTLTLERTVQQLHEENRQLQTNFDEQLKNLTESISENTQQLEGIAVDREKLQAEKEDLEKRLAELSEHYNEALKNKKHETSLHVAKLIETEQKCNELMDEKTKLESKTESLCAQLIESELRCKDLSKKLVEAESNLNEAAELRRELESIKYQLNNAIVELTEYKNLATTQTEAMNELEKNFRRSVESEEMFKSYLNDKEEYIIELEKQRSLLEQRLQESESNMRSYAEQLSCLKKLFNQLQDDFGDVENLEELHKMVIDQRKQLQETTEQKRLLTGALKKKDLEIEQHVETLSEQSQLLEQKEAVIKMLSEKDEEQANIITLLRNNLEIRAQADVDLNQQIMDKDAEIESLLSNVETRKEQISQLEKIILTLEEQTRKASTQKRKDRETILLLEKKVAEFENYYMQNTRNIEAPTENLDHLIKMLEHELGSPFEGELNNSAPGNDPTMLRQKNIEQSKRQKFNKFGGHGENNSSLYKPHRENMPTKIVMGNFVKKTYVPNEDQHKGDNLDRKKAITSMETKKWLAPPDTGMNMYTKTPCPKDRKCASFKSYPTKDSTRTIPYYLVPNHLLDEKKCKMYKLAGHRM